MKNFTIFLTIISAIFCLNFASFGQTNPTAQNLPFSFNSQTTTTLPAGIAAHRFGTATANIPTTRTTIAGNGDIINVASASTSGGWAAENANGISLLASGTQAAGAIVVAINTTGRQNVQVSWICRTILQQASRDHSIALQYRVGTTGDFIDVGTTTTYTSQGKAAGDVSSTLTETLPSNANNKPVVQVRWVYWESNGTSGSRDRIAVDDISITSSAIPNIDLTIDRTASPTTISANGQITYTVVVSNLGTDNATGVKAAFVVPQGLNFSSATTTCGFTSSVAGSTITFNGGSITANSSCNLDVVTSANGGGFVAIANLNDTVVDPDNTIVETSESNNRASSSSQVTVQFPSTVVGLSGRTSLAQLMNDINNIGGVQSFILDQNLTETANVIVPDFVTFDFENFIVSGNITFTFGRGSGAGFRTTNINGLGDASHPGCLQVTQVIFDGVTDVEYYQFTQTVQELGSSRQTAYNNPPIVRNFRVNNAGGLNIVAPFEVTGDFFLTNGIIFNGTNTISLSEITRINGSIFGRGSESSFVNGKIKKFFPSPLGSNGLANVFEFPIGTVGGDQDGYSPLVASNYTTGGAGGSLAIQVFDTNPAGVRTPSLSRYWQIDEIGDVTTDLKFIWRSGDESAITDPNNSTIIRNGLIACNGNCILDFNARSASITNVSEFSPWSVAMLVPTAADAYISGRVLNSRGFAQAKAKVLVTDQSGNTKTAVTNDFGNYQIEGLRTGETYIVNVIVKQAQYSSRVITLNEDAVNIDFTPQE